jgi:hypothetical protein
MLAAHCLVGIELRPSKGEVDSKIANGAVIEPSRTLVWLSLVEDGQFN